MKFPRFILPAFLGLLSLPATGVPVNVALNQPAEADSVFSAAYPPSNAFDGNNTDDASRWLSADGMPHWIEVDLGQTYSLSRMQFWTGKNDVGPFPLYDFALQFWNGTGWTDLYSETGSTNTGTVDVSFGPTVSGNRVRLNITAGEDGIARLFELEIHGEPHGLGYTTLAPASDGTLFDAAADLVVTFDAAISAVDLGGIRIEDLDTSTDLAGVTASVSGNALTIFHGGLGTNGNYAVHIPATRVALASDGGTQNGAIYWEFATAPLKPQLVSYTDELPGLTGDLDFVFDRDISVADPSGISIKRASDNSLVTGVSASATGDTLSISHDAFVGEEAYIVVVDAGAVTGNINGAGNDELRRVVFAGSSQLLNADFTDGTDGFDFADTWFTPDENWWQVWRRSDGSTAGPDGDTRFLISRTNWKQDFTVSPAFPLNAADSYNLNFRTYLERILNVGYVPVAAVPGTGTAADVIAAATVISTVSPGGNKTVKLNFTPAADGDYHVIFFSGDVLANSDQEIDSVILTRAYDPVIAINSPAPSSSFLESDSIAVEVEAYGISAPVTGVSLYDDGELIGAMTKTGEVYTYDWSSHAPGTRTLTAVATDSLGNTSTTQIDLTVTFNDGTLPPYIGWDLDDGAQGWTFTTGVSWYINRARAAASGQLALSSPEVFLFAGEPYTVQFKARTWQTSNTFNWAFLATDVPAFPSDDTGRSDFNINSGTWTVFEIPFTVPVDGPYHLTFFDTNGSYNKVEFDDIRLIGNFNSVPQVELTLPASSIKTIAGADLLLEANPVDLDGTILSVEFRDASSGQLLEPGAVLNTAPWTYAWSNLPEGEYSVFARAIDDANGVGDSAPVSITVAPNLYSLSTYLGGSATDEAFTGAVYLGDGTLVMSGIMDPGLFPGAVIPAYLNGSVAGDRGVVVRLSEDGQTVLSVTVVGTRVLDIDTDGSGRIFVAAGDDGVVVLDSTASTVLWANDYGAPHVHRVDAADGGTFAVITSSVFDYLDEKINTGTNYVYDTDYVQLGTMGGIGAFTTDVAVDEATQTVVFIGWKNITNMEDDTGTNPVDIPGLIGRAYDGSEKWRGYDWGKQGDPRGWLNEPENNMADTRGCRVIIGPDGKVYAGIEFDGGNTPLRYSPLDITVPVSVVGGDPYHTMSNTSTVPKTFVGRYDPASGAYETGQWITNRLDNGNDNTLRIRNGNLFIDAAGRIHVVGGSAAGLPLTHDPLPGTGYTGGAYHLVYSPDFTSREYVTRLTLSSANGLATHAGIAVSPSGKVATAGRTSSPFLFDVNAWQSSLHTYADAQFAVGVLDDYYKFQTGVHPRLFFNEAGLQAVRDRLGDEPYASMLAELIAQRDYGDFYRLYTASDPKDLMQRAQASAFLHALTGNESYATDARNDIETAWGLIGSAWASTSTKGLDLYWYATKLATAYDLCANSPAWDAGFNYQASRKLVEIARVIETSGGAEQPSGLDSNWAAARGSSAGIAFLASDHSFDAQLQSSAHTRTLNYLNFNQGPGATRGWNPEGFGYTAFAIGSYLGPYAIAAKRLGVGDLTTHAGLQWMPWTGFAGATTAMNVYGLGGVKTDWSDDNAHTGGEGIYGLAFAFAPDSLKPGLVHAYDRFMGAQSPFGPNWDTLRAGTFWAILYYPSDVAGQDPTEIWDWHQGSDDSGGLGVFTFRNAYQDSDDILVQFKARLREPAEAHDGPDGLGFRIIGLGDPFAVGGGRDPDLAELNQATVYPSDPDLNVTRNSNTGALVGTPLVKPDGGGHVIASMATNNVGTTSHKRWFVTDYDSASTGAEAVIVVADTSSNGTYWQLPTFLGNTVTSSGNTFTITGSNGATLKGTILHPGGSPAITIGTKLRGSSYTIEDVTAGDYNGTLAENAADPVNFPPIEENRYLHIQGGGDGDFLVVLTLQKSGPHPVVTRASGTVADAVIQVGNKNYALQNLDVLYSTGTGAPVAYSPPDATVTFDADDKGTLGGAAVQSVPYGGAAIAPVVSPFSGYTFMGWNKAFAQVVKSMTVTALYDAIAGGFGEWIGDDLWGLGPADQDPGDNPDGDAYNNLLEYALVLNPSLPDGEGVVSVRVEGGNLILHYRARDGASDITVTPRHGSDLSGSWTAVPGTNITPTGAGPNYTEYEASMPIGSGPVFLILEVTRN